MKKTDNIYLALIAFIYYRVIIFPYRVANDLHYNYLEESLDRFQLPQTWSSWGAVGLGEPSVSVLWNWPIGIFFSWLGKIGMKPDVAINVFGFLFFVVLATYGLSKLITYYKINSTAKNISVLLFLLNTYIILLVDGGQLNLAFTYAILPLTFYYYLKTTEQRMRSDNLVSFILFSLTLSFFDIRIVYFLLILIFCKLTFDLITNINSGKILSLVKTHIILGIAFVFAFLGAHAYWVFPSLLTKAPSLPDAYGRVSQLDFLGFVDITHAFYLFQPHWYKNVFGKISMPQPQFIFIPIFVFLAGLLKRKNKHVSYWLIISIISVFLAKGINDPFGGIYEFLFSKVPGFNMFRDSSKFYFLVALSYSVLTAFTLNAIAESNKWNNKIYSKVPLKYSTLISSFFVIMILITMKPVILDQMTGTFSDPIYKKEFLDSNKIILSDDGFGRTLWLPTKPPLGFSSPHHPSVEAIRLLNERPFSINTVGSYEQLNYLREGELMGQFAKIAGISYISYPYPDIRRDILKQDNIDYYNNFLNQLGGLPWIKASVSGFPVPVLKTKESPSRFFIPKNTYFIIGSDRIYDELASIPNFNLSQTALVFAEEIPLSAKNIDVSQLNIVLYGRSGFDLAAAFIPGDNYIFPAEKLPFDPGQNGWWKRETGDFLWWRNFLQEKYKLDYQEFDYGGGMAISEGENQLTLESDKIHSGDLLFARILNNSRGGSIRFYQENDSIGPAIATDNACNKKREIKLTGYGDTADQIFTYDCADFLWVPIGTAIKDSHLKINTTGDINAINAILSISPDQLKILNDKLKDARVTTWDTMTGLEKLTTFSPNQDDMPELSYKRISPTHYKVKITKLSKPTTLAFSEKFDSYWKLDGKEGYQLYSLINGFSISKEGELDLFYEPQKYVLPGMYLSIATFVILVLVFLRSRRKV